MLMLNLAGVVDDWFGKQIAEAEEAALDLRAQVFNLYLVLFMSKLW